MVREGRVWGVRGCGEGGEVVVREGRVWGVRGCGE